MKNIVKPMKWLSKNPRRGPTFTLKRFVPVIFLICIVFPAAVLAQTPAEYRDNVSKARETILELIRPADDLSGAQFNQFEQNATADIRRLIPESEKIEWDGTVVETDNRWLHEALDSFADESGPSDNREQLLTAIHNRLEAIENKIGELVSRQAAARSKDQDKNKLAEILRREQFQKPEAEQESLFQRIVAAIKKWFSDFFPDASIAPGSSSGLGTLASVLQFVLAAAVFGGIAFLIYRFAPTIFRRNRTRKTKEKGDRFVLGEKLEDGQNAPDIFRDAERLAREGNLRGAIRKGYIALLCELSDRKVIGLAKHKTNRDYLRDVRKNKELFKGVSGMTFNYERHWYGYDPAGDEAWQDFKSDYLKVLGRQPR